MSEKRRLERLSPLVIRTRFLDGADTPPGYLTNMSESGAFLATDRPLEVGQSIRVDFTLPWGLGDHQADASVVWRFQDAGTRSDDIPIGVGLAFTHLAPEVRESIRRYMARFHEVLTQIEVEGLGEVLSRLTKETPERA